MPSKVKKSRGKRCIEKRFLSNRYSIEFLQQCLIPTQKWRPYPLPAHRDAWRSLPEKVRQSHIALGETAAASPWPHLPASLYIQFAQDGNRRNFELPYFERRNIVGQMLLAECCEGLGRFVQPLSDALWSICEESSWCLPAHISTQVAGFGLPDTTEPIVDLFAAETAALLAWADYLIGSALDQISPLLRVRIRREIQLRVLDPAFKRDDFWWMGFTPKLVNNWNPWINSNWLACVLLLEERPEHRAAAVHKILESLDCFIAVVPPDGGCDEGPSYWGRAGASLFDCLELLYSATLGKIDVYGEAIIREIGRFIYRAHIDGEYYVNFADAPARLVPEPALVFRYGQRIEDDRMMSFGAFLAGQLGLLERGYTSEKSLASSPGRALPALMSINDLARVKPHQPRLRDVWLPDLQVMIARDDEDSNSGFYLAVKGGHNDESHNHNDVGHYIIYMNGRPMIVDVGVETYTRKTFSADRYEIWTMQSAYHSLPTIGGVMQEAGRSFAARDVRYQMDEESAQLSLDLAGAYPPEARLKSWVRSVTLQRRERVEVSDTFELLEPVPEITFSLITPCQVVPSAPGLLVLGEAALIENRVAGSGQIFYDPQLLRVTTEEISIQDERLSPAWGHRLTRILFHMANPALRGSVELQFFS